MHDYYRNPPRVTESHEARQLEYPKDFEVLHSLVDRLAKDYCKKVGTQAGLSGLSLIALREIEQSVWCLLEPGFNSSAALFHAINAQLFSRPAVEIAVRNLLFLHDVKFVRTWEASDWETMVLARHFNSAVFDEKATPTSYAAQAERDQQLYTQSLGLTSSDEEVVIRRFKGTASPSECEALNRKLGCKTKFPTVSEICLGSPKSQPLLHSSRNLPAAQILCRYYKILCHSTHGGKNSLMQRALFRGVVKSDISPKDLSEQDLQQETIWIILSLQLLLATITAHAPHTNNAVENPETAQSLVDSWRLLGSQCALGRELYEFWYKPRYGIL